MFNITLFWNPTKVLPKTIPPQGPHAIIALARLLHDEEFNSQPRILDLKRPYLRFVGDHGEYSLDCTQFLSECTLYVQPSQDEQDKGYLIIRLLRNTSVSRRIFSKLQQIFQRLEQALTTGFYKSLQLNGVGNKLSVEGQTVFFTTGVSHPIAVRFPVSVFLYSETPTRLTLFGFDYEEISQWAARLRYHIFRRNPYAAPVLAFENEVLRVKSTRKR